MGRDAPSVDEYFIGSQSKSLRRLLGRSIALISVRWLLWLIIGLGGKLIITSKLKGFVDIVASLKWLPLHSLIDLIVIANVWQRITKIDLGQKIIGIGRVVSRKSKAVITYTKVIRNGGRQYLRGMVILAKCVVITKAVYWLPITSKNERIIPNCCLL